MRRNSNIIKEMSMTKLIVEGREVKIGDLIVVEGDNWEEIGMVVSVDDEEINMWDGKEGWFVKRDEIKKIYFR
jgi:FKBP-type peptidyl-prolyl cis-trans isomerase 2